jgi:hypothetical protein
VPTYDPFGNEIRLLFVWIIGLAEYELCLHGCAKGHHRASGIERA